MTKSSSEYKIAGKRKKREGYLGPGPVEYRTGGGGRVTELRGGEEALANADEAVRGRGARFVTELLHSRLQVPAANSGVERRRSQHYLHRSSLRLGTWEVLLVWRAAGA